jgi:hypothetical protein
MLNPLTAMNAVTSPEHDALSLVEIIDFKWLMAGDGHRVHVEHLQNDPAYACACLKLAAGSHIQALRETAARLAHTLGIELPAA